MELRRTNACIFSSFSLICNIQYKLKTRCRLIYYNMISLIVYYWLPPMTMIAVLATIVAGEKAQIRLNVRLIQIYYILHYFFELN
jgi:hypothetical protein